MTDANIKMETNRLYLKVGFTGTRVGLNDFQKAFLSNFVADKCGEFHHGDCIGADADAHDIVRQYKDHWKIIIHPPSNSELRAFKIGDIIHQPLPYLARNKKIVADTSVLIAMPKDKQRIGGTWHTIRYAEETIAMGSPKQCHIILPTGEIGFVRFQKKGLTPLIPPEVGHA